MYGHAKLNANAPIIQKIRHLLPIFFCIFCIIHNKISVTKKHGKNHNGEFESQYPNAIFINGLTPLDCNELSRWMKEDASSNSIVLIKDQEKKGLTMPHSFFQERNKINILIVKCNSHKKKEQGNMEKVYPFRQFSSSQYVPIYDKKHANNFCHIYILNIFLSSHQLYFLTCTIDYKALSAITHASFNNHLILSSFIPYPKSVLCPHISLD